MRLFVQKSQLSVFCIFNCVGNIILILVRYVIHNLIGDIEDLLLEVGSEVIFCYQRECYQDFCK